MFEHCSSLSISGYSDFSDFSNSSINLLSWCQTAVQGFINKFESLPAQARIAMILALLFDWYCNRVPDA
jgi:hypothetical protein